MKLAYNIGRIAAGAGVTYLLGCALLAICGFGFTPEITVIHRIMAVLVGFLVIGSFYAIIILPTACAAGVVMSLFDRWSIVAALAISLTVAATVSLTMLVPLLVSHVFDALHYAHVVAHPEAFPPPGPMPVSWSAVWGASISYLKSLAWLYDGGTLLGLVTAIPSALVAFEATRRLGRKRPDKDEIHHGQPPSIALTD